MCLYHTVAFSQIKTDIEYSLRFPDTSVSYTLLSDSHLMSQPRSIHGKGFRSMGKWQLKDSVVTFTLEKGERRYKPDSVLSLHFLVGLELSEEWGIIKAKVFQDLEKDEIYQVIISDKTKEWVTRRLQFQSFDNYIIGKNILIELPPSSLPRSKKKKR